MIKTDLKTLKSFQDMWLIKWSLSSLHITPRLHERGICGGRRPGESQCGSPCGSEVSCPNSNANTHISRLQSWPKGFRIRIFAQRWFPPHPLNMTCVPQQCGKTNCDLYPKLQSGSKTWTHHWFMFCKSILFPPICLNYPLNWFFAFLLCLCFPYLCLSVKYFFNSSI